MWLFHQGICRDVKTQPKKEKRLGGNRAALFVYGNHNVNHNYFLRARVCFFYVQILELYVIIGWFFYAVNSCSYWGTREHGLRRHCSELSYIFLWIYELQLNKISHNAHQLLGYCIHANTCWWIHLWYVFVKIQDLYALYIHGTTGTFSLPF